MIDYTTLPSREIERLSRSIGPGEWAIERHRPISTLLGSCVAVCLYDTAAPIAGMNHFMLPQMKKSAHADEDVLLAGDACMEALLNAMLTQGAARHRIRAKAFGGGTVIEANRPNPRAASRKPTPPPCSSRKPRPSPRKSNCSDASTCHHRPGIRPVPATDLQDRRYQSCRQQEGTA